MKSGKKLNPRANRPMGRGAVLPGLIGVALAASSYTAAAGSDAERRAALVAKRELISAETPLLPGKVDPERASRLRALSDREFARVEPLSANPLIAFLPAGVTPDHAYWQEKLRRDGLARAEAQRQQRANQFRQVVAASDSEPNNDLVTAQLVAGVGTGPGDDPEATLSGDLSGGGAPLFSPSFGPSVRLEPVSQAEDNGATGIATATGLGTGSAVTTSGFIGDGPHGAVGGTGSGDLDFLSLDMAEGQTLTIDFRQFPGTGAGGSDPDFIIDVFRDGTLTEFDPFPDNARTFQFTAGAAASDQTFVRVRSFNVDQTDIADPASGTGSDTTGDYRLDMALFDTPTEVFQQNEDDGSLGLANPTDLVVGQRGFTEGSLGDGPHGGTTGDFDWFRVDGLTTGQVLMVETAPHTNGLPTEDTIITIFDSSGTQLAEDDDSGSGLYSAISFAVPANDNYFVRVREFGVGQGDPTDSGSGTGPGSGGGYSLIVEVEEAPPSFVSTEDDGAIGSANPTGLAMAGDAGFGLGEIGDGQHGSGGSGSGDFDWYRIDGLVAGETISAETSAGVGATMDTVIDIYDSAGNLLATDDEGGSGNFSAIQFAVPSAGDYFVAVRGFLNTQTDPFDSSSGSGAGSEGFYRVDIERIAPPDIDCYAFELVKGDVLGASGTGSATALGAFDPNGELLMGSRGDLSGLYAPNSPLPGGGATVAITAPFSGNYGLCVTNPSFNTGAYTVDVFVSRPGLDDPTDGSSRQTIFLDFDGATINAPALFGSGNNPATISPLSAFLGNWGLTGGDEDAVIDAIIAVVRENLEHDLSHFGNDGRSDVVILNSRDHADPFGQPHVAREIIGGTIAELGISTIGIAEFIDPGNFGTEDTSITLLDLLSGPSSSGNSINQFTLAPGFTIIQAIGRVVGNIVSHEVGHKLGLYHTDQFNAVSNLQDQGGNLPGTAGVGADGIMGNADDMDVDFVTDTYVTNEGLFGGQPALNIAAFALTTPFQRPLLAALGDVNSNGFEDQVVAIDGPGGTVVNVRDGSTGGLISTLPFVPSGRPLVLRVIPDQNGNGSQEVALLARNQDNMFTAVQVRDSLTGFLIAPQVPFRRTFAPVDMVVLPDLTSNGSPEISVLGIFEQSGTVQIETRDLASGTQTSLVPVRNILTPQSLVTVNNFGGGAAPELGVTQLRQSDMLMQFESRDALLGGRVDVLGLGRGNYPIVTSTVASFAGGPSDELLVLRRDPLASRTQVVVRDIATRTPVGPNAISFNPARDPLGMAVRDIGGNPEVAVLQVLPATGAVRVEQRNANTAGLTAAVNFGFDLFAADGGLAIQEDLNGNGSHEFIVLGQDLSGTVTTLTRDSSTAGLFSSVLWP